MASKTRRPDLEAHNFGTIITLRGLTPRGRALLADCSVADWQVAGDVVSCEPRCALDILHVARSEGLILRDGRSGRLAGGKAVR